MTKEFGAGRNAAFLVQMILVTPSLSIIVGAPLAGLLGRGVGPKVLMLSAIAIYALAGTYGVVAPGGMSLIISRVVLGFASGLLGATALARVTEFNSQMGLRLLGFANAMAATTAIGSFVLGGWLTREFGWRSANYAYLWVLVLVPVVLVSGWPRGTATHHAGDTPRPNFPWRATMPIYSLAIIVFVAVYSSSIEGPFVLVRHGMTDPAQIGIAISGSALSCVLVSASYGWIARLLDERMQFIGMFCVLLASALITSLARSPQGVIFGMALTGVGAAILSPLLLSRLIRAVPSAHVATASGLFASATFISVFLTPLIYKMIVEIGGVPVYSGLAIFAAVELLVTVVLITTGRLTRRSPLRSERR